MCVFECGAGRANLNATFLRTNIDLVYIEFNDAADVAGVFIFTSHHLIRIFHFNVVRLHCPLMVN